MKVDIWKAGANRILKNEKLENKNMKIEKKKRWCTSEFQSYTYLITIKITINVQIVIDVIEEAGGDPRPGLY